MDETASFGYWVRRQRKALDLTQDKLAEAVGCAAITIKKIEGDERRPSRQIAERLAVVLSVPPQEKEHFLASARGILSPLNLTLADHPLEPDSPEPRHNLPVSISSFVGRSEDLRALQNMLRTPEVRLVSLLGPGGIGKTRLAIRVAKALLADFPDGVYFFDLSSILPGASQAERVQSITHVISQTLLAKTPASTALQDALRAYLRPRKMLLVMDNFEHLLDAASLVEDLLSTAEDLKVLVTSREAMCFTGEYEYLLGPLEEMECRQLFYDRARAVNKDFTFNSGNAKMISGICQRLDGIPLAIELAAARTRFMSVGQIASRLDNTFHLLASGSQNVLPRHQTLKAAIDWSYNLLAPNERLLLQRLSVFAGGWRLEAAEAVCADGTATASSGEAWIDPMEVLDLLGKLVDKSLVIVEILETDEVRYRLLETIRQYGRERLLEGGVNPDLHERHLAYFAQLSAQAESNLRGRDMLEWMGRLQEDLENLRTAMEWALRGKIDLGMQITADLMWFFHNRGMFAEGVEWIERLLTAEQAGRGNVQLASNRALQRARALRAFSHHSNYAYYLTVETEIRLLQESLHILRSLSPVPRLELGITLFYYASYLDDQIDLQSKVMEEALPIFRQEKNFLYPSLYYFNTSWQALNKGNLEKAHTSIEASLSFARQIDDINGIASEIGIRGRLALYAGDYKKAEALFNEALELMRKSKCGWGEALWYPDLISVAGASGNYSAAIRLAQEAIAQEGELNYHWSTVGATSRLIWIYWSQGDYENALQLGRETFPENPDQSL